MGKNEENAKNDMDDLVNNVKLQDLIDLNFLQKFQDAFSKALGVASISSDENGVPVTKGSNFTDFCMKLTRGSNKGNKRCMKSDAYGGSESLRTGKPSVYFCDNGLMDFAVPIVINGKQIGCMIGGQTLPEVPNDMDKYSRIANEIGVDPDEYIAALKKVKVVPEEKVRAAADILYIVANQVSKIGYEKLVLKKVSSKLHESVMQIMATTEQLTASASDVSEKQNILNHEVESVKDISEKIDGLSEQINTISERIKLLGLNASIEAARVGEAGAGFGVVAKEIHKLSAGSKETVGSIKNFTNQIHNSIGKTTEMSSLTLTTVKQQEEAIKSIVESMENITHMTDRLTKLGVSPSK